MIALQRRLFGGANRVLWRAQDLRRIAVHFGVSERFIADLPAIKASQAADVLSVVRAQDDGSSYTFTISTADVDHMEDRILVHGWRLGTFNSNPIVQYAHDGDSLPVGRATRTWFEGGGLKSSVTFSSDRFAQRVKAMLAERSLRAASVGFIPGKWEFSPTRPGGIDFIDGHTLLEWSIVNVPANPQCLVEHSGAARSQPCLAHAKARLAVIRQAAGRP